MQTGKFVSEDVEDQTEQVEDYKYELIKFHLSCNVKFAIHLSESLYDLEWLLRMKTPRLCLRVWSGREGKTWKKKGRSKWNI